MQPRTLVGIIDNSKVENNLMIVQIAATGLANIILSFSSPSFTNHSTRGCTVLVHYPQNTTTVVFLVEMSR